MRLVTGKAQRAKALKQRPNTLRFFLNIGIIWKLLYVLPGFNFVSVTRGQGPAKLKINPVRRGEQTHTGRLSEVGRFKKRWVSLHPTIIELNKPTNQFVIIHTIRQHRSTQPTKTDRTYGVERWRCCNSMLNHECGARYPAYNAYNV